MFLKTGNIPMFEDMVTKENYDKIEEPFNNNNNLKITVYCVSRSYCAE
jgi:hypothetical protein